MKIETWYDICCDNCSNHLSTDFGTGMSTNKKDIKLWAKEKGWKYLIKTKENVCPNCLKLINKLK